MKAKLIGVGAAGNKAAMAAIEAGVFDRKDVMILNTTRKDMKKEYDDINIEFGPGFGGCGKERNIAKELMFKALKQESINIDSFPDPGDDAIIIVSSSEGGTGCGAAPVIAKYVTDVLNMNVHLFVFTGFEEDVRGVKNTIEYFQELTDKFTVEAISNKKFLADAKNKAHAEQLANQEFVERMKIYLGINLRDSDQNIDDTDLYKINTTPGFMSIEHAKLDNIKNTQMFVDILERMLDTSKSLEYEPTARRIGVFLNISKKTQRIDFDYSVLRERMGEPYEFFTHVQEAQGVEDETISVITSGIKMPRDEVQEIYTTYLDKTNRVDKNKDAFFDNVDGFTMDSEDSMFDFKRNIVKDITKEQKDSFFNSFDSGEKTKPKARIVKKDLKNY